MIGGRAIVVGGGIGGLATAIALVRAGWKVEVHEQSDALREIGAGLTVWPNGVKALRRLGVEATVVGRAAVIRRFEVRRDDGHVLGDSGSTDYGQRFGASILCVPRPDLLAALAASVDPTSVRLSSRFVSLEERRGEVIAHFEDGHASAAELLVGADGIGSRVRGVLLADGPARYAGYTCYAALARTEHAAFDRTASVETWGPGARFGLLPCGPEGAFWWAICNAPEHGDDEAEGGRARVQRAVAGWHEPIRAVVDATPEAAIFRLPVRDRLPVKRWGTSRAVLLGDAAHPSTPNLGQGASMALEDALILASSLGTAPDLATALEAYVEQRRARTAEVTLRSRDLGRMGQLSHPCAVWLRNRVAASRLFQRRTMGMIDRLVAYEIPDRA